MDYKIKAAVKSTKILIIEDDAIMTRLLRDILEVMGFGEITTVKDGNKALQEVIAKNFDLIFCDWKMLGMDGIEFTKLLRMIPYPEKCFTPVVMITGKARKEDVEVARDAGVTEYVIKPFTVKSLCEKIKAIVERPREFVLADSYKGPDRRRRDNPEKVPQGKERRKNGRKQPDRKSS